MKLETMTPDYRVFQRGSERVDVPAATGTDQQWRILAAENHYSFQGYSPQGNLIFVRHVGIDTRIIEEASVFDGAYWCDRVSRIGRNGFNIGKGQTRGRREVYREYAMYICYTDEAKSAARQIMSAIDDALKWYKNEEKTLQELEEVA